MNQDSAHAHQLPDHSQSAAFSFEKKGLDGTKRRETYCKKQQFILKTGDLVVGKFSAQ